MLHEERTDVDGLTSKDLQREYETLLAEIIAEHGVAAVAEETGVNENVLAALVDGESPAIDIEEAAAIQAVDSDLDVETVYVEACEHLLLGMSMAVLDVDTIAGELSLDLSGKEVQQKLERRAPMSLAEFTALEHLIASRRQ